ncbi:MAG: hypothetical protein EX270_05625 [Pseudomonadales bacterium]|nr:MAG: hypothetical protein EX270_05625 [Pseudomonadales bacterium]
MEIRLVDFLMRWRNWMALFCVALCLLLGVGMQKLYFQSNYKVFFTEEDPQRVAHESQMEEYARSEDEIILLSFSGEPVFTNENLTTLQRATEMAWNMPYATRVDSLINYQYSRASEDELIVSDFIESPDSLDAAALSELERIARAERQVARRLVSTDGKTAALFVSLIMPPEAEPGMDEAEANQRIQKLNAAFASIAAFNRKMRQDLQALDPNVEMYTVGNPSISQTFTEMGERDLGSLVPMMFAAILISLALFLRSVAALVGVVMLIALSTAAAMGFGGFIGYTLNPLTTSAPTVILTLAVCDSVHLLVIYLRGLASGQAPEPAMREALMVNIQPIALTSITTAVGFLTLNFSFSPAFVQFGNITAFGVMMAMLLSLCMLPAISIKLIRSSRLRGYDNSLFTRFANFTIRKRKQLLPLTLLAAMAIITLVPLNGINDDPTQYFDQDIEYRQAADFSEQRLPGMRDLNFSLNCGAPGCVNNPAFLHAADAFTQWIETQEYVESVFSFSDVLKRINRNMHGDDPNWYQVPESEALAAQFLLLYELSLPYGLDMTNQVNFDKSAIRVTVLLRKSLAREFIDFEQRANLWLQDNYPELASHGSSVWMMFAKLGLNNIHSMILGSILAIIGVTLTICLALRSLRYGLLSLVPNAFPAAIALGIWGATVGYVNMAVASIFSITLGIIIDDSVHFISKYRRAREQKGYDAEQAVHYAFNTVGAALVVTTIVLGIGFSLLATSSFNLNGHIGAMTTMTVVIALVFDFLVLPPLLLAMESRKKARG